MKQKNIAMALALASLAVGCDERAPVRPSTVDRREQLFASLQSDTRAQHSPAWPEGWMAVSEEEWVPAQNMVGRELCTAHKYFVGAELETASSHLATAANALRSMVKGAKHEHAQGREGPLEAAVRLEDLAARIKRGEAIVREDLDSILIEAQRSGLGWQWRNPSDQDFASLLEIPRMHFQRARSMLKVNAHAEAAARVRRGAAYLRVAAQGARAEDRATLEAEVGQLLGLAHKADVGELSPAALDAGLARTDAAIAASYLRDAEARYEAKQPTAAERSLRVAAASMRARSEWSQTDDGTAGLAREVERTAHELALGARLRQRRLADLVSRATRALGPPVEGPPFEAAAAES